MAYFPLGHLLFTSPSHNTFHTALWYLSLHVVITVLSPLLAYNLDYSIYVIFSVLMCCVIRAVKYFFYLLCSVSSFSISEFNCYS